MIRFRLFGIPFGISPAFWIGSAILGSNFAHGEQGLALLAIWVACVFVSILLHELGHALMARRFGVTPYITFQLLGGTTFMIGGSLTRPQALLVTLAGPVAGLATWALVRYPVIGLLRQTSGVGTFTVAAVSFLLFINLYWTLFNLLPILPLDGGKVVLGLLGPNRQRAVQMLGGIVAVVMCLLAVKWGQIYLAFFVGMLALENFRGQVARPL